MLELSRLTRCPSESWEHGGRLIHRRVDPLTPPSFHPLPDNPPRRLIHRRVDPLTPVLLVTGGRLTQSVDSPTSSAVDSHLGGDRGAKEASASSAIYRLVLALIDETRSFPRDRNSSRLVDSLTVSNFANFSCYSCRREGGQKITALRLQLPWHYLAIRSDP